MIDKKIPIYLASKSPRRRKLLKLLNIRFKSFSVDVREELQDGEHPVRTVKRLAMDKFNAASKKVKEGIVITADTIVVLNKEILGKPRSKKEAFETLSKLSGNTHTVYTGFVVANLSSGKKIIDYEKTKVTFRKLERKEILNYIDSGSPMDKAGSYGIQDDYGALFISKINGCYYNVVGLPIAKVNKAILDIIR
ncbi:Putative septum formation protein [Melioribacter roseus P3M-2]|uniref:dTTP/UTP pyrophosphatase n=1 Tax=Melioribacter roseus (strain DSM 23840 / JCM 17771 / VKM B-2668 / P3M-2) TaxID=1191523 RepID=I7A449_MELRP|nr:Maf family protein [Melioribacter roseus]AFN75963.1 Putative septum formation protein [Melioribacter roseus P3M-2]